MSDTYQKPCVFNNTDIYLYYIYIFILCFFFNQDDDILPKKIKIFNTNIFTNSC